MPLRVLVLTPDQKLGDLLRRALVNADGCQVVLAQNSRQANRLARQVVFDLAIVDESIPDDSPLELARCLREYQPRLHIIPLKPQAGGLAAADSLELPAEVQAVLHRAEAAVEENAPVHEVNVDAASISSRYEKTDEDSTMWMLDPGLTEQRLRSIDMPRLVYAVVIVRRESLWAYCGSLPRSRAGELARVLAVSWSREQDPNGGTSRAAGDMLRYVQLGDVHEFLLYARGLRRGLVLGLAFPPATPFNTARSLMEQVQHRFLSNGSNGDASRRSPADSFSGNGHSPAELDTAEAAANPALTGIEQEDELAPDLPSLSSLLGDVPVPTPESVRCQVPEAERIAWSWELEDGDFPVQVKEWLKPAQEQDGFQASHPACTFVLIPRRSQHSLSGEIATQLFHWLSELAYGRGWRLEGVSIRPDYLKFSAVPLQGESPDTVLQIVRQHTTRNIFAAFPDLVNEHQGLDFWAENSLAAGPDQPITAQVLRQYLLRAGRRLSDPKRNATQQATLR